MLKDASVKKTLTITDVYTGIELICSMRLAVCLLYYDVYVWCFFFGDQISSTVTSQTSPSANAFGAERLCSADPTMGWMWRHTSALSDIHEAACFGEGFGIEYVKRINVRTCKTGSQFLFFVEFGDVEQKAQYRHRGSSGVQADSEERRHAKACGPDMEVNDSETVSMKGKLWDFIFNRGSTVFSHLFGSN